MRVTRKETGVRYWRIGESSIKLNADQENSGSWLWDAVTVYQHEPDNPIGRLGQALGCWLMKVCGGQLYCRWNHDFDSTFEQLP